MKASQNPYPYITLAESAAPGTPSSGYGYIYTSTGGTPYYVDDSGTASQLNAAGGGAVATDAIWDAAGDLAVGTGANTASRLAKGADGGVLAMGNGAVIWNAGTSFPASKATNDRYWRTDLGLEFYWDGTRWLTTTLYEVPLNIHDALGGTTNNTTLYVGLPTDYAAYLVKGWVSYIVAGTNDGSNYWTLQFQTKVSPNSATNRGSSFTTTAAGGISYASSSVTMGIALTTSELLVSCAATKTLNPGALYFFPIIQYRLIGT